MFMNIFVLNLCFVTKMNSVINLFFADKDGGDLKIASHHRATAYDDYRREIARILS